MMNNNKEFTQFKFLIDVQNNATKQMFIAIDNNDISTFSLWFTMWVNATNDLLKNKYNECGHKLCDEIMDFANKNNVKCGWNN